MIPLGKEEGLVCFAFPWFVSCAISAETCLVFHLVPLVIVISILFLKTLCKLIFGGFRMALLMSNFNFDTSYGP